MTTNKLEFKIPVGDSFNFDLDKMKKALESPSYKLPENLSFEEFDQWIHQIEQKKCGIFPLSSCAIPVSLL